MKPTAEEILKSKMDELNQDNGSFPSFKHMDKELKEYVLEAMEEYASLSSPKVEGSYSERVPTDDDIERAILGNGWRSSRSQIGEINGMKKMRATLLPILESQARTIEALEENVRILKEEKSPIEFAEWIKKGYVLVNAHPTQYWVKMGVESRLGKRISTEHLYEKFLKSKQPKE